MIIIAFIVVQLRAIGWSNYFIVKSYLATYKYIGDIMNIILTL